MTEFGKLHEDGTYVHVRTLPSSALKACPHVIFMPEHYRADNTCRCDDADHTEMAEWGYRWNGYLWVADEEEDD